MDAAWVLPSEVEVALTPSLTTEGVSCASLGNVTRRFAAISSPLTDSNRRPPPYHGGGEGVDACRLPRSGAASSASVLAASRRVLHVGATRVRDSL